MSDLDRLRQGLRSVLGTPWVLPGTPNELVKQVAAMASRYGGVGARPSADRVRAAVDRFRETGQIGTLEDARRTCFGAIELFTEDQPRLIENRLQFRLLLVRVDGFRGQARKFRRIFRALLVCYFAYDPDLDGRSKEGKGNWTALAKFLLERFDDVRVEGFEPNWVGALANHRNLLSDDPVSRYAAAALRGDMAEFEDAKSAIEIPETSWVVRRLVIAQVEEACSSDDEVFKPYVASLLIVLGQHAMVKDNGLALLVNRYAKAIALLEHRELRDAAIGAWGNPLLQLNAPRWGQVSPDGQRMIANWLKLDLIQQFFEVLSEERTTDQRRVRFWARYHEQMDGMYFALGPDARESRRADIRRLRERMGDLELSLIDGGKKTNNAFIMRIGGYVIVEFGVTGNACFIFEFRRLPFNLNGEVSGNANGLKHPDRKNRLLHNGVWEEDFEKVLASLGIRPGSTSTPSGSARPRVSRDTPPAGAATASAIPYSRGNFERFVEHHRLETRDSTLNGGNIWVKLPSEVGGVASQLRAWGFRYARTKRQWYREG